MVPEGAQIPGVAAHLPVVADARSAALPTPSIARTANADQYVRPAFVLLSFEGPDAYSRAGGLGARINGLAHALAEEGHDAHLFFIGSPDVPGHEVLCDGKLHLHRWCQWISAYHPGGVYDGEEGKLYDWNASLPAWLEEHLLPSLIATPSSCAYSGSMR